MVLAYNEATGSTGYFTVTATWSHVDEEIVGLVIDEEWIETTPEHPFYTLMHGWVKAEELWVGAAMRKSDGSSGVVRFVAYVATRQPMFNLSVADAHTFFVGDGQWLVHNSDCEAALEGAKNQETGEELVQLAKNIHSKLNFFGRQTTTIAAGKVGNARYVAFNNKADRGVDDVVTRLAGELGFINLGRSPNSAGKGIGHPEPYLLENFGNKLKAIGISRAGGLCEMCQKFFGGLSFKNIWKPKGKR